MSLLFSHNPAVCIPFLTKSLLLSFDRRAAKRFGRMRDAFSLGGSSTWRRGLPTSFSQQGNAPGLSHVREEPAAVDQIKRTERDSLSQIRERARRELADFQARENQEAVEI